jgi:F0F1-type ATP synthase membrane subunit b/b'
VIARRAAALTVAALTLAACGAQERVQEGIDRANEAASEAQSRVDDVREQVEGATARVEFCVAAAKVVAELEQRDYAGAIDAGQEMVAKAPAEIQPQARTVLDGLVAFRDGDSGAVQSESFTTAAEDLKSYTLDSCDPRD